MRVRAVSPARVKWPGKVGTCAFVLHVDCFTCEFVGTYAYLTCIRARVRVMNGSWICWYMRIFADMREISIVGHSISVYD